MSLFVADDEDYWDEPMEEDRVYVEPQLREETTSVQTGDYVTGLGDHSLTGVETNPAAYSPVTTGGATLTLPPDATDQGSNESIPVVFTDEEPPVYSAQEVWCNLPLHFYREIAETLLAKDGLLVLGHGLGHEMITANVLHALSTPRLLLGGTQKRTLVMVLGARDDEIVTLNDVLGELRWMDEARELQRDQKENEQKEKGRERDDGSKDASDDRNDDVSDPVLRAVSAADMANPTKRRCVYAQGGVLAISARVLVVDLLSGLVTPSDITGMVVLHAERVRETLSEAFIVNLYRDGNRWGFVKAVLDTPEAFTGFTPLALRLKVLRLTNVFLWPRFHVAVLQSLVKGGNSSSSGTVTEVKVRLSRKMAQIQQAILACLGACLGELRRHNGALDSEYWQMDNVHDADFVGRVRRTLEPQWHRILWTLKQLVHDVGALKELLAALVTEDLVAFYQRVQGIVDANVRTPGAGTMGTTYLSPWLMMDEATTIMAHAKARALGRVTVRQRHVDVEAEAAQQTGGDAGGDAGGNDTFSSAEVYSLEELPKWEQLAMVVDDVMHERSIAPLRKEGPMLIMCASASTAQQLAAVLQSARKHENSGRRTFSCRRYMVARLRVYLQWKDVTLLTRTLAAQLDTDPDADDAKLHISKTFTRASDAPTTKRRRTRGALAVASVARLHSGSDFERTAGAVDLDAAIVLRVEAELVKLELEDEAEEEAEEETLFVDQEFAADRIDLMHVEKFNQVVIGVYDDRINESLLQEVAPSYIVMYEPDLSFIRRVEIFQALNPASPAKVYFMYYGTSVEEQTHLLSIRKEKRAFTRLIKEKAALGKHFATEADNFRFRVRKPQVANTRIAGGATFRTEVDEMQVVVDTREFRSSLPNLLYRAGIKVIPCMITVGDYILSPKLCVERKAIPDLISSFKSGRLYQQCEQMFRHYESPVLLIEFDESKSFSFEPFAEFKPRTLKATNPLSAKILKQEIQLKITELLMSFPKLKIIWSSSPYETAQIFLELKASQEEPDIEEALSKGVNPTITTSEGPPMINDDVVDLLQTIPGINNVNYATVIQRVRNMSELVCLSREKFIEMLGEENGNKAYTFINHKVS